MAKKQPKTEEFHAWASRIVGHGEESPDQLLANPLNWRKHPNSQRKAMQSMLDSVGYVQSVIVNRVTGHLVDGHLRVELALRKGQPAIPVVYVELTEAEEKAVLMSFDPIGTMAGTDKELLDGLLKDTNEAMPGLAALAERVEADNRVLQRGDVSEIMDRATYSGKNSEEEDEMIDLAKEATVVNANVVFPSSNSMGIPDLLPDMLSTIIPSEPYVGQDEVRGDHPIWVYGSGRPKSFEGYVVSFFTWDVKFEQVFTQCLVVAQRFRKTGIAATMMPDFSLWHHDPPAINYYNLYKSRWCARMFQEVGMNVIPVLHWTPSLDEALCFDTLPKYSPVVATQCRTMNKDPDAEGLFVERVKRGDARVQPKHILIYGGMENRKWLEPEFMKVDAEVHYLPSWTFVRDAVRSGNR